MRGVAPALFIVAMVGGCGSTTVLVAGDDGTGGAASGSAAATGGGGGAAGCPVFVDGTRGDDAADGRSWDTAKATVAEGIAAAAASGCALWVAEGTYLPSANGDRAASFTLAPGLALYGGFSGAEQSLEERDPQAHVTVLSGDVGQPGVREDNSFHVVQGAEGALLDGVTVRDGYADGSEDEAHGGGVFSRDVAMTLRGCRIEDNRTAAGARTLDSGAGAGVFHAGGSLVVTATTFEGNETGPGQQGAPGFEGGRSGDGGGLYVELTSSLLIEASVFVSNRTGTGGAISPSGAGGGAHIFLEEGSACVPRGHEERADRQTLRRAESTSARQPAGRVASPVVAGREPTPRGRGPPGREGKNVIQRLASKMHWAATWPPGRIKLLGLAEVAGATGLVLPMATGIAPWLTPLAALCLAALMAGAIRTHERLGEKPAPAAITAVLCIVVALGRFAGLA